MQKPSVIIVGAGPAGIATAACLHAQSVPYIILEREDCIASLWKKYSYDRLHLHLAKQFCELPFIPFPPSFPTFISKRHFIEYLDDYVSHFKIRPIYHRSVTAAAFDEATEKWVVTAANSVSGESEEYSGRFLVVATGEVTNPFVPEIEGLEGFGGEILHSTKFKSGKGFCDKNVLVVGAGNSSMEIALDLANHGAKTSIVVRSPIHIISREMAYWELEMLKYLPLKFVDSFVVMLSKLVYRDMEKYGMRRPAEGPFYSKVKYGKYPVMDVGTYQKIRTGEIQVMPAVASIRGNEVLFENGKTNPFDTIIFATGFKRPTKLWLKDDYLLGEDGLPKESCPYPNHWKGKNGLYCVGLARRGLYGIKSDALNIATHISSLW